MENVLNFKNFVNEKRKGETCTCLTEDDKAKALKWYKDGVDIQTIADHFELSVDDIKKALRKGV